MASDKEDTLSIRADGESKAQPVGSDNLTEVDRSDIEPSVDRVTVQGQPQVDSRSDASDREKFRQYDMHAEGSATGAISNTVANVAAPDNKEASHPRLSSGVPGKQGAQGLITSQTSSADVLLPNNIDESVTDSAVSPNIPGALTSANAPPAARVSEGTVGNKGAYVVWVADERGTLINPPKDWFEPEIDPNPSDPKAVNLAFFLLDSPQIPHEDQVELQLEIAKVEKALRWIFKGDHPREKQFQIYFVRLFHVAQLGVTGQNAVPGIARRVLNAIIDELIDEEGGRIKNGYLAELGKWAALFSGACFGLFFIIKMTSARWFLESLGKLNVDPFLLSAFAVLWIGCFVGVWLSYGIRKPIVSLADLTRSEDDRVAPAFRLVFAALLTTIIGLLFSLDIIAVTIGGLTTSSIKSNFMVALLIGMFCGISELALPTSVNTRAKAFITKLQ